MKKFFKQVLAVVVGCLVASAFTSIITLVMFLTMFSLGEQKPEITEGTVLHLNLNGTIEERAKEDPLALFFGTDLATTQGLDDILTAIRVAADNEKVAGIYIEGGMASTDFATLEEIRKALTDFKKKTGKFVVAYGDNYTQGAYYVASAADQVMVNPSGMVDWHGIASQPIFFKELLEKVGVKMQVFRVGTYKSAVEPFTETAMSEANRRQVESFIGDIWTVVCKDVAASRNVSVDSLNAYADRYMVLADGADYLSTKLVDKLAYVDQARDELRRLAGTEELNLLTAAEMAKCEEVKEKDKEVAVYYAYGDIVGDEAGGMGGNNAIVGSEVVADLDELMNDDDICAVVLRINSGGGSAYASEQMWRAIQLLRAKKPVVVSMGGLCASGGYYMACGANTIVAEPTTLTGSIGIFGMVPDASGLLTEKLGLHFDVVKTNEASDFGAMGRGFTPGESAAMQAYVERGYRLFLKRVADGRKMTTAEVDSIAQGRVWTGRQAKSLKLVDRLGTLEDAIAEAARLAKAGEYSVARYPQPTDWLEQLSNAVTDDYMEGRMRLMLGEYYQPLRFIHSLEGRDCLQARMPFVPHLR